MELILLIVGLAGLWVGTELLISGATYLALRFKLSEFFIGVVILSIGSDLPELAVAVEAGLRNKAGIDVSGVVVGSSIGSAFSQIGLVMALLGLTGYVTIKKTSLYRDGAVLLGSIVLLALMGWDGVVSNLEGVVLIVVYIMYVLTVYYGEQGNVLPIDAPVEKPLKNIMALVAGMFVVVSSSELTVNSALSLADQWGIGQMTISFVLIGVGTSLPELSISLAALVKKKGGMSVGNLIGSNILDTLVPIGLSATIARVTFDRNIIYFDLTILFALSLMVLIFFKRKRGLQRSEAIVIMGAYIFYVLLKVGG